MATPLEYEEKLYKVIRDENIKVHPVVWELLNHHMRNDLMMTSAALSKLRFINVRILNVASLVIKVLFRVTRHPGREPEHLVTICSRGIARINVMDGFLRRLRDMTFDDSAGETSNAYKKEGQE